MYESVSTITSKGQVTIPSEVRRRLGLAPSDKVAWIMSENGDVVMRPARVSMASLYGSIPALPPGSTQDLDEQIREAMDDAADEIVRELQGQ